MTRQIVYTFEELPIIIDHDGFAGGLVNGSALLSYWTDGQWGVTDIYLDGARRRPTSDIMAALLSGSQLRGWEEKPIPLDRGTPLHLIILDRLEHQWRPQVQEVVNSAIETEREMA